MPKSEPSSAPPLAFHPYRIVIGVGFLIVLGSMSLPFVTTAAGPRSSVALAALPVLALLLPVFGSTLLPDHSRLLPRPLGLLAAGLVALAIPYAVVTLLDATVLAGSLDGSTAVGPWLLVAGSVVVGVGVALNLVGDRRRARAGAAERRLRASRDENPFGEPLFDSLELNAPQPPSEAEQVQGERPQAEVSPSPARGASGIPTLVFEAERAATRVADEDDGFLGG